MPYHKEKNILFLHIPKTGGMSIEHSIMKGPPILLHGEVCSTYQVDLQHLTFKQIKDKYSDVISNWDDLFIFAFIRNPYRRLISEYSKHWFSSFDSFEHFVNMIKRDYRNIKYNNHLIPQHEFIYYKGKNVCNFMGRQENYEKDFYKLCDILNVNEPVRRINRWAWNRKISAYYKNNDIKDIVYELYKKDFELLLYHKDEMK